jgi:hypothetical protein
MSFSEEFLHITFGGAISAQQFVLSEVPNVAALCERLFYFGEFALCVEVVFLHIVDRSAEKFVQFLDVEPGQSRVVSA